MVTREGTVKVMDFGIARVLGPETAPQTSAVLGTASYLSPEQAQGGPVDARTDIYSLGAVLYELLTGRPPFVGDSPVAVAYKQVNETPAVPSSLNADVPARLDAVVMKALSKNPSNRYQSAEEFSDDLQRVVAGQEVEATPLMAAGAAGAATQVISRPSSQTAVLPPPEEPKGSGRKVWLGVLIGLLLFALLAGGGYLLVNSLTGGNEGSITVFVPNVVGETQAAAEAALAEQGLNVSVRRREVDPDEVDPGTVVAQNPKADAEVARDSEVTIFVAVEPDTVPVPELEGLTVSQAQSALRAAGLTLGSQLPEPSTDIDAQLVIRSDPPVDTEVEPDSAVDIVVSTGPEMVEVPDVSTGCLAIGGAKQLLKAQGLEMVVGDPVPSIPECPNPNRIIGQDPVAGTTVEAGTTVTVFPGGGGDV
ncbi:MAG: PASTA domain-containing protein, partial [Actinomycetota bacterium]|nr:PASTA domain-containing protein [Actinomycetota bacterium]